MSQPPTIADLLSTRPLLHLDGGGQPTTFQVSAEALRFISERVRPGWSTLETGAGLSTVAFALQGAKHIAITPSQNEADKIVAFCGESAIPTDGVRFIISGSEVAVPALAPDLVLDFVLIDGAHAFPIPFIDWYYTSRLLRVGGWMVIDDIELWTGRVLRDFMKSEPEWDLFGEIAAAKTVVFRKNAALPFKEWCWQPYVVSRSDLSSMIGSYDLSEFPGVRWSTLARDVVRRHVGPVLGRATAPTREAASRIAAWAFEKARGSTRAE